MSCVTNADALAVSMVGAAAAANEMRRVAWDALCGRSAFERRLHVWEANVAFISSLGLDPDELLGPPPVPAEARVPAAPSFGGLPAFGTA